MKRGAHVIKLILVFSFILPASGSDHDQMLYMPRNIRNAYEKGTRSPDGRPGDTYWQNRADYSIAVEFDPATRRVTGTETIFYMNNSPDTLKKLYFHLFPNLYKKGVARDFSIDAADESDGVTIESFTVAGRILDVTEPSQDVSYDHTQLSVTLDEPIGPGADISMQISWNYILNQGSHMRTGGVDSSSFFIAYFFPRIAVYDDINGWNTALYTGRAEFYNDFGNYEVAVTVPEDFLVWATGTLENPQEVLSDTFLERYKKAYSGDEVIHIIDSTECTSGNITRPSSHLTWKFRAQNVTDFAFATSDHYLWDGSSIIVDEHTGRRVFIDAAYDKSSKDFFHVADIARQAVHHMSTILPGIPFPFPKITIFNGGDGMEYPMMVNNVSEPTMDETIKLTVHEILHSYFPFYVGTNETRYAWMDEGFTTFGDYLITRELNPDGEHHYYYQSWYVELQGTQLDIPVFTISDFLKKPVYTFNSYPKPAAFFFTLRDLLGPERFVAVMQEFFFRWHGKHPIPYDLFFTLNDVSRINLNWLIRPWFFEFGYVDLGLQLIGRDGDRIRLLVDNKGGVPAPVHIKVFYEDGSEELVKKTAGVWESGTRQIRIDHPAGKAVSRIELLNPTLIDGEPSNDVLMLNQED